MKLTDRFEAFLFRRRVSVIGVFAALTVFFGYQAAHVTLDAGFEKLLPLHHPFMRTFRQYQEEFGGANRLLIAVRARDGDMFTPEFFRVLKDVTDEVFFLPGVNRGTVSSLYTPNVRFIEIVEGGFTGGNVIPADFTPSPPMLATVRENILKSGTIGRLVANDFSAAMVTAELLERDPATGRRLDYLKVAKLLDEKIRSHADGSVDIHIIGFAQMLGDIARGATSVMLFFGLAVGVAFLLVLGLSRSFRLALLPLAVSVIGVIWSLGLLVVMGIGLDPMSLLVPFLVFAIGMSHGVQMVNAFTAGVGTGIDGLPAARAAFNRLKVPGLVALLTDALGFVTLLVIRIGIIRELALACSTGVLALIFTNLILLPLFLSYLRVSDSYRRRICRPSRVRAALWRRLARFAQPRPAAICLVAALLLGTAGLVAGRNVHVGDVHPGIPELRGDSRYNRDAAMITSRFSIGVDILTVLVETVPQGCVDFEVMDLVDRFQWRLANVPGVQSTLSLPQVARLVHAGWNEGHLAWRALPRDPLALAQAVSSVETSTGLLNADCSVLPVLVFTADHKAETIDRIVAQVRAFAAEHDSGSHRFRLATGNLGVMAAANEVVRAAQLPMLLYVYLAVIALCLAAFRSVRATLCIALPLGLVSVLTFALMNLLEIGLKVYTLPVTVLGVGIGVDYGIYLYSQLRTPLAAGRPLPEAYQETLRITGNAVLVTGLTLAVGTSTWMFSALKFQADMGILLTFMFLGNMIGALLLLPSLGAFLLKRR